MQTRRDTTTRLPASSPFFRRGSSMSAPKQQRSISRWEMYAASKLGVSTATTLNSQFNYFFSGSQSMRGHAQNGELGRNRNRRGTRELGWNEVRRVSHGHSAMGKHSSVFTRQTSKQVLRRRFFEGGSSKEVLRRRMFMEETSVSHVGISNICSPPVTPDSTPNTPIRR